MALTDGLISSWRYNTNFDDLVGVNHGTPSGALIDASVKHVGAGSAFYDGLNDSANYGNDSSFNVTTGLSTSLWVYIILEAAAFIISKVNAGGSSYYIFHTGTGSTQFGLYTSVGLQTSDLGVGVLSPITWYNPIYTYDGSNMRTYVDGVLKKKTAHTGTIDITTADVITGTNYLGSQPFGGNKDQTDMWSRALTFSVDTVGQVAGGEIGEMYNGGLGLQPSSADFTFFDNED